MTVSFHSPVPVFRIFDVPKAREFYVDYLGFTVDWEHRFTEGAPLYMQVTRDSLVLHLSEHHGDSCPGSTVYTEVDGVDALHAELHAKDYAYLKPGLEKMGGTGLSMELLDPFGNKLRLVQPPKQRTGDR